MIFYDFYRKLRCNNLRAVIDDKQLAKMNFVFCEVAVKLWLVVIKKFPTATRLLVAQLAYLE